MIILTIRSDKPEAEIGIYNGGEQLAYKTWLAHRKLAETLHETIQDVLTSQKLSLKKIEGIVCYKGPGSFTGLRIGLTVANALSYSLHIPIVSETGDAWQVHGVERLEKGESEPVALPEYGADVHITLPKR